MSETNYGTLEKEEKPKKGRCTCLIVCCVVIANLLFLAILSSFLRVALTPDADHCKPSPCLNGGVCQNEQQTFTCDCPPGYTGNICDQDDVDECLSMPCQNGGACTAGGTNFTCTCLEGYSGFTCDTDIGECASSPCQNGGACRGEAGAFTCDCTAGYGGASCEKGPPRDCYDLYLENHNESGVYEIYLAGEAVEVYCDMDGGGWLVFQRRSAVGVDFNRSWAEYKVGFGNMIESFWLGNDKLHLITNQRKYKLQLDLKENPGDVNIVHALYEEFDVASEEEYYRLEVGEFDNLGGDVGDGFEYSNGRKFSTADEDHDGATQFHCGVTRGGGWWYNGNLNCGQHSLNDPSNTNKFPIDSKDALVAQSTMKVMPVV